MQLTLVNEHLYLLFQCIKRTILESFMFFAQCLSDFSLSYGLPFSLFLAGLVGGFTHCVGMCSPFVLAQVDNDSGDLAVSGWRRSRVIRALLLPYHLGRMTTYVVMAFLLAGVLNLAFMVSDLRVLISVPLLMLAGVLFLVSAFPALSAVFPWAVRLQVVKPISAVMNYAKGLMKSRNFGGRYMLGVLLGFMPCGMVVSALLAAASASNAIMAAGAMAAFALGTMPALMVLSLGGAGLTQRYPIFMRRFKQGALTLSAIWLFILAGAMVF